MNFIVDRSPTNSGICIDPLMPEEHDALEWSLSLARLMPSITGFSEKNAALREKLAGLSS